MNKNESKKSNTKPEPLRKLSTSKSPSEIRSSKGTTDNLFSKKSSSAGTTDKLFSQNENSNYDDDDAEASEREGKMSDSDNEDPRGENASSISSKKEDALSVWVDLTQSLLKAVEENELSASKADQTVIMAVYRLVDREYQLHLCTKRR